MCGISRLYEAQLPSKDHLRLLKLSRRLPTDWTVHLESVVSDLPPGSLSKSIASALIRLSIALKLHCRNCKTLTYLAIF